MPRFSSKAKQSGGAEVEASAGSSSAAPSRREESGDQWLRRVHEAQTSRMPPERRQELQRKVEQSRLRVQQSRKCKAISSHNARSHMLVNEGLRQMASSSAPGAHAEVTSRWKSAQDASEARQHRRMEKIEKSKEAPAEEVEADESSDEGEGVAEMAALVGAADLQVLTNVGHVGDGAALDAAGGAGAGAGGDGAAGFDELLQQVRVEPREAAECMAKFGIYEGYSSQLEKIRASLFEYYEETGPTVPDAVRNEWERKLKKIDTAENMGIMDDDGRVWFVYHMMKAAERNNRSMTGVLQDFQRKIELLAKNDQTECPVCLDEFTEAGGAREPEVLSCCHKICKECWDQWKQVTHGHPFCPLCKNEEFLDLVHSRVA